MEQERIDNYINIFNNNHNNKYDYKDSVFINLSKKIKIKCPIHGYFYQGINSHRRSGCPSCGKLKIGNSKRNNTSQFINKSKEVHGNIYDYSDTTYSGNRGKVTIICNKHGKFEQIAANHLAGNGCKKCGIVLRSKSATFSTDRFLEKSVLSHGNKYDYSEVVYVNSYTPVTIKCKIHGKFKQLPYIHYKINNPSGCPKCGKESQKLLKTDTKNSFIQKATKIHGNQYDYTNTVYKHSWIKCEIVCKKHGPFSQAPRNHLVGVGCEKCTNSKVSKGEIEVFNFLKSQIDCEQGNRKILKGKEIDIYIPSLKIGVEFNGIYWHSDKFKDKNYHLEKLQLAESKGVYLVQIFEDEWVEDRARVKKILTNIITNSFTHLNSNKKIIKINRCYGVSKKWLKTYGYKLQSNLPPTIHTITNQGHKVYNCGHSNYVK